LMINSVCGIRSTGRICTDIAEELDRQGHEVKIAYGREAVPDRYKKYAVRIGTDFDVKLHGIKTRLLDRHGFGSTRATKQFIKWVKEYDPDVIHLHNLHGYYINIKVLFDYLRDCGKKIVWTLHDCWALTGHCSHFDYNGCNRWESECKKCKFSFEYPKSYFSNAKRNYNDKARLFKSADNMKIVVPSQWMYNIVKKSYLKEFDIDILPNGIDLDRFQYAESNLRKKYRCENKFVVLGVASTWVNTKGIEYINRLADDLPEETFTVVMIGNTTKGVKISDKIIHVPELESIEELCKWYSCADVFVNPTLQETQGLTTIEALACGTPVVVFKSGGAAECISCDELGISVERGDYQAFLNAVISLSKTKSKNVSRDKIKKYDKRMSVEENIETYFN